ncbi:MAG TPA: PadR family transcriptional regulator [Polyangiaceae bacterium]|nr:PadR family transcriptional regulator [Polyangiaceae bacterium]
MDDCDSFSDPRGAFHDRSTFWSHAHAHGHAHFQGRRGPFGPHGRSPFGGHAGARNSSWGDWFGSPPPRAERGGVRYLVLDALAERPRHGYEVIQVIEERSGGSYRPSPGVIYPTLQMLEELGHARVVEQDNRKVYEITDQGRADLEAHRDEVSDFYERFAEESWESYVEDFGDIMKRLGRLFKTFRRAGRRGSMAPKTMKRIGEIIDNAVGEIEAALDEER